MPDRSSPGEGPTESVDGLTRSVPADFGAPPGGFDGWPTYPATTPEGEIQGVGRLASRSARGAGWRRWVTVVLLVAVLAGALFVLVQLVL